MFHDDVWYVFLQMDEMRSLQPTSGYFVVVPQSGDPRYGGTQSGNIFIENEYEAVVEGFCKGKCLTSVYSINSELSTFNCPGRTNQLTDHSKIHESTH